MKKTLGIILSMILVASLALVIVGAFKLLNMSEVTDGTNVPSGENTGNNSQPEEDTEGDSTTTDENTQTPPEDDNQNEEIPEPEIIPEVGVKEEYTEVLENIWTEDRYHASYISFEEEVEGSISVKMYFGTFIGVSDTADYNDTVVRIVLRSSNSGTLLLAELAGKDFYNDNYLCEKIDETSVKYTRMLSVDVPSILMSEDKGQLTFEFSAVKKDAESGVEMLFEKVENNIYYKKTDAGYKLDRTEEKTIIFTYEYLTDISDYIDYIEPTGDNWSDEYLLLVNPWNPIEKGQELTYDFVGNQVVLGDINDYSFNYRPSLKLNETAAKALTAMFKEALATGKFQTKHMQVVSAHRGYDQQESIFNRNVSNTKKYVCTDENCAHVYISKNSYRKCEVCGSSVKTVGISKEEAQAQVKTYSCAPGTSEHQTGLAVDLADITKGDAILEEPFKDTAAGKWLAENCTKFGFILRFEADKQDITGIIYEPWHFRYVGRYHATRMTELGLCLEEYVELLKEEGYFDDADSVHNPSNMEIAEDSFLIKG